MDRPLPNYFLADLPTESVAAGIVTEACQGIRRNRAQFLAGRSTSGLIRFLSELAEQWLQPEYPFRRMALRDGPGETGFSEATLAAGLDGFFRQLNPESLHGLLQQDLGTPLRLDGFAQTHSEIQERRSAWAHGPELTVHIAAGNLPNPTLHSMVLSLLTRSAQFVKCATGASLIPRLFAHSIYDAEPKLAACLELACWPGGTPAAQATEAALFAEADLVTATGGDEALASIRGRLPLHTRFLGYGSRVSFGFVTAEALTGFGSKRVVQQAAADVAAWDQQGCLSPHVIYVQPRGGIQPEGFAELLAAELEKREPLQPRGTLSVGESAVIASARDFYQVRAAHSNETRIWSSPESTAWTVVYESDPLFQFSCLNRFIHVKPAVDLDEVLRQAERIRGRVSTVGLAATPDQAPALAQSLARWGVSRICPLGSMQNPPLSWRHDGRPSLADLVRWTDWEQ